MLRARVGIKSIIVLSVLTLGLVRLATLQPRCGRIETDYHRLLARGTSADRLRLLVDSLGFFGIQDHMGAARDTSGGAPLEMMNERPCHSGLLGGADGFLMTVLRSRNGSVDSVIIDHFSRGM